MQSKAKKVGLKRINMVKTLIPLLLFSLFFSIAATRAAEADCILPSPMGDMNGDGTVGLIDAVLGLKIACNSIIDGVNKNADVNKDQQIGMEEAIYIMQKVSGLRGSGSQGEEDVIVASRARKISQLIGDYDRHLHEPTINLTDTRFNLAKTDLGVPFQHKDRTYILFGDAGYPPDDPIAYTTDTNPENGLELTFLSDEDGSYRPIQIPGVSLGAFEVPTAGVSINNRMYIYMTTDHSAYVTMGRSIVAFSDDDGYTFQYLHDLSTTHFINVAVVKTDISTWYGFPRLTGVGLVMFGSGTYRKSNVRLAFQPADSIESPDSVCYFSGLDDSEHPRWSSRESDAQPLFNHACVGELSVSYNRFIGKWIMLYNCDDAENRGINVRTANAPWGPWSENKIIFDPSSDGEGYCHYMHVNWSYANCDSVHDPGREYEWGGEYGPYQFGNLATGNDSSTTIYFTMSTWNPYTVVLMKATLGKTSPTE